VQSNERLLVLIALAVAFVLLSALLAALTRVLPLLIVAVAIAIVLAALLLAALPALLILILVHRFAPCGLISASDQCSRNARRSIASNDVTELSRSHRVILHRHGGLA
jgi:hypothetical protein